ncbi:MAG TPA: PE family protein [Mycobacterium sp.]|nr:PE family protein [Mycobacterium sp.]
MSSYVIAAPEAFAVASGDLTAIGEAIKGAAAAAAPSTTGIVVAAGDEVSAAITSFLGSYAQAFQTLSAQATLFHAQFVRALSAAGAAYAAVEAANVSTLQVLEQQAQSLGVFSPVRLLTGHPLFGNGADGAAGTGAAGPGRPSNLPGNTTNGGVGGAGSGGVSSAPAGVGGAVTNTATNAVTATIPPATNGVTGVKVGFSILEIQVGPFGYPAPTHWYFPTQADGSVHAHGVIYLQHGFGAIGWFYNSLAIQLAESTDSIVVVPTVSSIPLPFGAWLIGAPMQQAVASLFLGSETALNISANHAGYQGTLPVDFIMTGHSAGGGLATIAAGDYVADLGGNTADNHLLGVVMFDGVAINSTSFAPSIANLQTLNIPDYVVAAPPQAWNLNGATTNELVSLYPGQFVGVELVNGSHVDSMLGDKPVIDFASQLVTKFSPGGNTAAVYTLSTGWINDMYAGAGPTDPIYGLYGTTGGYLPPGGQQIILGPATGIVLPV